MIYRKSSLIYFCQIISTNEIENDASIFPYVENGCEHY